MDLNNFQKCFILFFFIKLIDGSEFCKKENCEKQIKDIDCDKLVRRMRKKEQFKLTNFEDYEELFKSETKKMFFVESSGRSYLTSRQACAVESAIRNSGLNVFVIAMTSQGNYCNNKKDMQTKRNERYGYRKI